MSKIVEQPNTTSEVRAMATSVLGSEGPGSGKGCNRESFVCNKSLLEHSSCLQALSALG